MDKRYFVVAGAFIVQGVIIGCVFSYGVFFVELETAFGWTRTQLSWATSLAFLSMGLMAAYTGQSNDRYGPRRVIAFAAVCTGTAYALLYYLSAPWQLYVIYGTLVGVGLAAHDVVTLSTIARQFPRRRGLMSGVVKVGTAVGQMSLPLLTVWLIATVGWRLSFVVLGVGAAVLLLIAAWLMGITSASGSSAEQQSLNSGSSFAEALKQKSLWLLCAVQFLAFSSLTTIPTHIVPHAIDSGLTTTAAAALLTLIAGSSIFGRLIVGTTVDQLGGLRTYNICFALLSISLFALVMIENPKLLYGFAVIYGFTHGGLFTVVSPIVAEVFGMKEHGKIFGLVVFFGTAGSIMPVVTGRVFDALGSYTAAFVALNTMAVIGFVLSYLLMKLRRPVHE